VRPDRMHTSYRQEMRLLGTPGRVVWLLVLLAALAYLPSVLENRAAFGYYFTETQLLGIGLPQVNFMLIAIMAALALNLLVGYTGLLSLGHAAFFSVGAITAAVLDVQHSAPFPVVILAAGLAGALVGGFFGLPSLRLRGLYLLLSTLALHFIALWVFLRYQTDNYGPSGIAYEAPSLFGYTFDTDTRWYFLLVVFTGLTLLVSRNLLVMREGRSLVAVRDHDIAAGAVGIHVGRQRIKAFALTSGITSAVGALYVYYLGNTTSDAYTLEFVISYFAIIIIGGMGSLLGSVLGAILWQLLPQAIQTLSTSVDPTAPVVGDLLNQYQGQTVSLILGLLVIVIMIFRPAGLNGVWLDLRRGVTRWPYSA
jgi:branched-chain amino acid transport system permease protein